MTEETISLKRTTVRIPKTEYDLLRKLLIDRDQSFTEWLVDRMKEELGQA